MHKIEVCKGHKASTRAYYPQLALSEAIYVFRRVGECQAVADAPRGAQSIADGNDQADSMAARLGVTHGFRCLP